MAASPMHPARDGLVPETVMRMPEIERIFALSRRRHLFRSWCGRFPRKRAASRVQRRLSKIILETQMLDATAAAPHQFQAFDPDIAVLFDIVRRHRPIRG